MKKNSVTPPAAGARQTWTPEQILHLKGIQTEIGAGKTFDSEPDGRAYNNACDRAIAIVQSYIDGVGLFMMTRNLPRPALPPVAEKQKLSGMSPAEAFTEGQKILKERQK